MPSKVSSSGLLKKICSGSRALVDTRGESRRAGFCGSA